MYNVVSVALLIIHVSSSLNMTGPNENDLLESRPFYDFENATIYKDKNIYKMTPTNPIYFAPAGKLSCKYFVRRL